MGALGAATMATTALTINGIVLIWTFRKFEFENGVAEVFAGDCHRSETINTWVHLAINAVSTMLLSGSNYCMQILSAPTRKEVDKAHAKQKWLDIGVPSVRNLTNVAWSKILMWWLLGLSSIPLHLMYNSVFFSTIATNEYDVFFVTEAFVEGGHRVLMMRQNLEDSRTSKLTRRHGTASKTSHASTHMLPSFSTPGGI